jgi:flagellar basal-body rod modification protein FlgD
MFLKLLVAQLKFQNPLQPTDPSTVLAQSAQFSMVEKLGEIATLTQSQQGNDQMLVAASLVGKKVSFDRDGMPSHAVCRPSGRRRRPDAASRLARNPWGVRRCRP